MHIELLSYGLYNDRSIYIKTGKDTDNLEKVIKCLINTFKTLIKINKTSTATNPLWYSYKKYA